MGKVWERYEGLKVAGSASLILCPGGPGSRAVIFEPDARFALISYICARACTHIEGCS